MKEEIIGYSCLKNIECQNTKTEIKILINAKGSKIVQKVSKLSKSSRDYKYIMAESKLMKLIHSPFVVRPIVVQVNAKEYHIFMPYYSKGDLEEYLLSHDLNFEKKIKIFLDILEGMRAIHQTFIIHRDIKLKNIFVDDQENCVIGDLGAAVQTTQSAESEIGTYGNQAPEVYLKGQFLDYDDKVDLWAIGIIAYQIFSKKPKEEIQFPFGPINTLLQKIKQHNMNVGQAYRQFFSEPLKFDNEIPEKIQQMIRAMLVFDPKERVSWKYFYKNGYLDEFDIGSNPRLSTFKGDYSHIEDERSNIRLKKQLFFSYHSKLYLPLNEISKTQTNLDLYFYKFYYSVMFRIYRAYEYIEERGVVCVLTDLKQWVKEVKINRATLRMQLNIRNKAHGLANIDEEDDCLTNEQFFKSIDLMIKKYRLDSL